MYTRLISHLSVNNLLYQDQYGVRAGYSNELALIKILNFVIKAWGDERYIVSAMMDL